MLSTINVGIPIVGSKGWLGGVSYIELLVKAVSSLPQGSRPKLFLIVTGDTLSNLPLHETIIPLFNGIIFVGNYQGELPNGIIHFDSNQSLFTELNFYYPVLSDVWPGVRAASWIPDFQHMYLPQFFSDDEMRWRSNAFAKIAAQAQLVIFSSNDALRDFHRFYPQSEAITRVLSFYALPQEEWYTDNFVEVQQRYELPDSFLICCNQIWTHKNHSCLFEAIAALHAQQIDLHLVCTGSTTDYRDLDYFPRLKELLRTLGIEHLVHIVGNIPRNDQIQLIRRSLAVVQPSLFEGWSTVVEDCRALGKTIILSDLPVHLEQAPRHGVYFDRTSSASLAQIICEMMPGFRPGPDAVREKQARDEAYSLADAFGRNFCAIVQESLQLPFGELRTATSKPPQIPLVSAIVSTYNSYEFIRGCLEDLTSQTIYLNGQLEIIIVNSGSQQNEEAVISEFQRDYQNIRYVKTERETLYAAWNRGVKEASGKYITNANTDDRHRPDALEVMCRALDENPEIDLVYGDCYVSTTPNETFAGNPKNHIYRYPTFYPPDSLLHYQFGPQPMWRKSVHDKIGFFDERFKAAGDYDFNIRFALAGLRALHIDDPIGLYLEHDKAISFRDDTMSRENELISVTYKTPAHIETLYRSAGFQLHTPEEHARIFADMGNRALQYYPTWESGKPSSDRSFAEKLYRQALYLDPQNQAALHNLPLYTGAGLTNFSQILPSGLLLPTEQSLAIGTSAISKSSRKILIACDYFWPSVGGTELFVEDIAVRLIGEGFEVDVATSRLENRAATTYKGIKIHQFKCSGNLNVGGASGEIDEYRKLIVSGGYESVIVLGHPDLWVGLGIVDLPVPRPRIILFPSINAENVMNWENSRLFGEVVKILKSADSVVAVTESGFDTKCFNALGIKYDFIPHAVEQEADRADFKSAYSISADTALLVMVANFWTVKNHLALLEVLVNTSGNWKLILIGHPVPSQMNYYQQVRQLASRDPRVIIIDGMPRDKAAAAIRDADILLVPSKGESAGPLVLLQAMCFGTPWIATPECNAVADEAGGVVAQVSDFPFVINKMLASPGIMHALGKLGQEHWQACFTWERVWNAFRNLLNRNNTQVDLGMPAPIRDKNKLLVEQLLSSQVVLGTVGPMKVYFSESVLAHKYCIGKGLEIGGSAHNPFGLHTLNVDMFGSMDTYFKDEERTNCGMAMPVDIEANGDKIPLADCSQDFIVSSHVLEHFPDPVKALLEWDRLLRPGGIIFMIVPHRDRTFEKDRDRSTLEDVVDDFILGTPPNVTYPAMHYHCWVTDDVVAIAKWMQVNLGVQWLIEEVQDYDDKVGNGFTIVIRKTGTINKAVLDGFLADTRPFVSIIVPTHNRLVILGQFFAALEYQTYHHDRFEVVVCDDGSIDGTLEYLQSLTTTFALKVLTQKNSGPAAARNHAIRNAKGDLVLIMNDDAIAEKNLVYGHVKAHSRAAGQKIAVLGSFEFGDEELSTPLMYIFRYTDILFQFVNMKPHGRYDFRFLWTCNISLPAKALSDAGFFDEEFREAAGEDTEFGYRLAKHGYDILYDPSCQSTHKHSIAFYSYCRRQVSVGRNNILVAKKHPEITQEVTGLPDIYNAEEYLIAWYRQNIGAVSRAMTFISDKNNSYMADSGNAQSVLPPMFEALKLVNQFWLYQGFMNGIELHLKKRSASKDRLSITFITPGTTISGGVKIIIEYCNRLAARGHNVNLVSMNKGYPDWIGLHPRINFQVVDWRDETKHFVQELPDADLVVATQWYTAYFVAALPVAKGNKLYLVQDYESRTIATPDQADPTYILPLRKVVVSSWLGRLLLEKFGEKSTYVRNAIDIDVLYPKVSARQRFSKAEIRIGMLWHIEERKGSRVGVAAFDLIRQEFPSARLILFGTSEPADDSYDEFYKNLNQDEMANYYSSLDVFISTSIQEGFGLPGLEAMACGVPLVTTDSGGVMDYAIHGRTALIVDSDNPVAMAASVAAVISNKNLADLLVQNGLKKAAEFSWDNAVSQLESFMISTCVNNIEAPIPVSVPVLVAMPKIKVAVFSLDHHEQACGHYRVYAPFKGLSDSIEVLQGIIVNDNEYIIKQEAAVSADVIVVQRFLPRSNTTDFLDWLYSLGKPVIFEIDDLLTKLPSSNPSYGWGMDSAPHIYNFIKKCAAVTVSTEALREHFSAYNDVIHVLPNMLDDALWCKPSPKSSGPIIIGYAGTITHATDLELVEGVLERIAQRYGNRVSFTFMGCATERLARLPGFDYIKFEVDYEGYARKLQEIPVDIMLIPLEDNEFNRCKSNIKWLEYSACGYAGVYADLPPYNTSVEHGRTGLLVGNNQQQWFEAIAMLIENADLRRTLAANARAEVLADYSLAANVHKWLDTYQAIIRNHTEVHAAGKATQGGHAPKPVSIIIPLFNNVEFTRRCIETLTAGTPQHLYELVLIDNGSTDVTSDFLAGLPSNVRVIHNQVNQGFSKACNQGAQAAKGKYLLFLNNDTEPQPGWLEALLDIAEQDPAVAAVGSKLLFPDGTIQHAGVVIADDRVTPDPLVGKHIYYGLPAGHLEANIRKVYQAMTAACLLVRRDSFATVDGFDEEYWNGYEDVDLCFKLGQKGWKLIYQPASVVVHHESKSGSERFAKAAQNIRRLHEKWLGTIQPDVIIHTDSSVEWLDRECAAATVAPPLVSIVIPLFNQAQLTKACIEAIQTTTGDSRRYELVLVDNGSCDWTPEYLHSLGDSVVVITNQENLGFAKACNQGARLAKGEYLLFLNNDTVPHPGWLDALLSGIHEEGGDIVGAKLLYPNGKVQHAGVAFNRSGIGYHIFKNFPANASAVNKKRFMHCVTAACLLVSRQLFNELGEFDEQFRNGFEDVDFCLRAGQAGKRILYNPDAVLIHHEEQSEGRKHHDRENMQRYLARWQGQVRCDDEELYASEGYSVEWHTNGTCVVRPSSVQEVNHGNSRYPLIPLVAHSSSSILQKLSSSRRTKGVLKRYTTED